MGEATVQSMPDNRKNFQISDPVKGEEHCSKQIINIPFFLSIPYQHFSSHSSFYKVHIQCLLRAQILILFLLLLLCLHCVNFCSLLLSYTSVSKSRLRLSVGLGFSLFFFFYFLNLMSQLILSRWLFSFQG